MGDNRKLKMLIAEDDKASMYFISLLVKNYCSEILKATTGTEAIKLALTNKNLDLILMDIKLPEIDGIEAIQRIRKVNKEVIIIAQTAYSLSGDRKRIIAAGCNNYISKPFNKTKLQKMIWKYF